MATPVQLSKSRMLAAYLVHCLGCLGMWKVHMMVGVLTFGINNIVFGPFFSRWVPHRDIGFSERMVIAALGTFVIGLMIWHLYPNNPGLADLHLPTEPERRNYALGFWLVGSAVLAFGWRRASQRQKAA